MPDEGRNPDPATQTEGEGETLDLPEGVQGFRPGQVLGERYEIRGLLGRGGMGEVWHAFDLKLRVEVALKALRPEFFRSERRLELLRDEVRAAREVVSPNVCRIFDLIEIDGRELVSMEYVDGATLLAVLTERGPLELKEAQDVASQFLAGLEAIHRVGLVHRDIKPENIMLTRAGRVVVMDFGLARQEAEGGGSVSGTPAYMSPEQAAGQTLDARADVYSAGVVLAEMVSPEGITNLQSRQSVWEAIRSEPAKVPDTPWAAVIKKAVAKDRDARFHTAHTLTRALEDVTLRVEGAEDLHPFPGLASFTEDDAEYFFGREAEVEQMWRKLEGPPRMLGLVGPSGAGKSSFVRAGLVPAATSGWATTICTPGTNPVLGLSRALAASLAGDSEAVDLLLRFDNPETAIEAVTRWRRRAGRAVLIVDQFEELFTQNGAEVQQRFAELLERLVLEADTHILLSMRDDFLFRCHEHDALNPVFSELSPIGPPAGGALRRALTQPALQCGYRFEDDELVDEMLAEVEGERGALPLLAFAAARLWEKRDREHGLLTRQAYHDIGGVGGALARHAEATVDRVGHERIPVVRELFRNLVTAEGTRAVREWNELLSVFEESQRASAEEVLRELIDARLLTSYEVREEDREPTRRVEIIHESLLANWPRLVRWQTQDADAVQLRDQLRQAAKTWDDQGRSDDTLWTGAAFREFASWRDRYPGGLTEMEEAFASAMTSLATRRRRRRRIAVAAFCATLLVVASVVAVLWQRSLRETLRAEAAGLLSQAQLQLESYPSAAVAYATKSLELADSRDARLLALEALWRGPPAFVVSEGGSWNIEFLDDGAALVQTTDAPPHTVHLVDADGTQQVLQDTHDSRVLLFPQGSSGVFATFEIDSDGPLAFWSAPNGELLESCSRGLPENIQRLYADPDRRRVLAVVNEANKLVVKILSCSGNPRELGTLPSDPGTTSVASGAPGGKWTAFSNSHGVFVVELRDRDLANPQLVGASKGRVVFTACDPLERYVATLSEDSRVELWPVTDTFSHAEIQAPPGASILRIAPDGSFLEVVSAENGEVQTSIWSLQNASPHFVRSLHLGKEGGTGLWKLNPVTDQLISILNPDPKVRLWSLRMPSDAEPLVMQRGDAGVNFRLAVNPSGEWLATSGESGLTFWPLAWPWPAVIRKYEERVGNLIFGPHGEWLATSSIDGHGRVRLWDLNGGSIPPARVVFEGDSHSYAVAESPNGEWMLLGNHRDTVRLIPIDGGDPVPLPGAVGVAWGAAISRDGRLGAASGLDEDHSTRIIRVWNLDSREQVAVFPQPGFYTGCLHFRPNGALLSSDDSGLAEWNVQTGEYERIYEGSVTRFAVSADDTIALLQAGDEYSGGILNQGDAVVLDLRDGSASTLSSHGPHLTAVAMNAEGTMAITGDDHGVIRVGPMSGEEPHLLLGSPNAIFDLAVDPRGRWIASSSGTEVRLWPMPDLSKPPLHTLPREELIAKLKTLTNLRVVRDPESATGWKLTHDPFPGWETVPTW